MKPSAVSPGQRPRFRQGSVGMFTYSTAPRGSVVHAAGLADALAAQGYSVTLYALDKSGDGFYRRTECGLELVPAGRAPAYGDELIRQRIGELQDHLGKSAVHHDIYHAQDCLTASALLGCDQARGRVVRTVHHIEHFQSPYLGQCQARSILRSDALSSVSRLTQVEVARTFGREAPNVGNGVDPNRARGCSAGQVVAERRGLLIDGQGPLLLSVGGVEARKNSLATLRAFRLVKVRFPSARWVIVGGATVLDHGVYKARFEEELHSLGLQYSVVQCGQVSEERLARLLCAADVLVNASLREGFGLAALDAAASGLPLVVSCGPPFEEYLSKKSAVFVDANSPDSIASGVSLALNSPLSRQLPARQVALDCSWAAVAKRTLALYERLATPASCSVPQPFPEPDDDATRARSLAAGTH